MNVDYQALLAVFVEETADELREAEESLLSLEANPSDPDALNRVFRAAHSLKANGHTFGFTDVGETAHAMEDLLDALRKGSQQVTPPTISLLLGAVDRLRQMVSLAVAGTPLTPELLNLKSTLRQCLQSGPPPLSAPGKTAPAQVDAGAASTKPPQASEDTGASSSAARAKRNAAVPHSLRVSTAKLDRLMDLVGEVAIARSRLMEVIESGSSHSSIMESHRESDLLFMALQEEVLRMRMVPLEPVFNRQGRTVRDVALATGKSARLVVEAGDVEVDLSVVEQLQEPLVHMVRNAIFHGIESPEVRKSRDKDACGVVTLGAAYAGGGILITISDDGNGLDRTAILEQARRKGFIKETELPDETELFSMIFRPGFSTAGEVSSISGRGVGMDVVRRNVEALRGTVRVESLPELGTTITIRLPSTVAIISGFAVDVAGGRYIIPLESVSECVELPREASDGGAVRGMVCLRGDPLPYVRLRGFFGIHECPVQQEHMVIVSHEGGRAALVVDALLGDMQTVIKPLHRTLKRIPGLSGSALLGNGQVAFILDVPGLMVEALRQAEVACA